MEKKLLPYGFNIAFRLRDGIDMKDYKMHQCCYCREWYAIPPDDNTLYELYCDKANCGIRQKILDNENTSLADIIMAAVGR